MLFLCQGLLPLLDYFDLLMFIHQLHSLPPSLRTRSLIEQSYYPVLGGKCFWATYRWVHPCTPPASYECDLGEGSSFRASPWVHWSCANRTTTTICSFVIWSIETKINLAPLTIRVFINFKLKSLPWYITSTSVCASHLSCEFQRRCSLKWGAPHPFHIMWNSYKFQCLAL